jgi:hypothetical protein
MLVAIALKDRRTIDRGAWLLLSIAFVLVQGCDDVLLPLDVHRDAGQGDVPDTDEETSSETESETETDSESIPDSGTDDGTDTEERCEVRVGQQMWALLDGTCQEDGSACEGGISPLEDQAGTCPGASVCCIDTDQCAAINESMMAEASCSAEACDENDMGGQYGCADFGHCCIGMAGMTPLGIPIG